MTEEEYQELLRRMIPITRRAESRDRDYDENGRPVTSPAGAKYAMQVMPATAGAPGYGVRPAAADNPAEYNRVGENYLGALLRKYGRPDQAWAAYNWGPGNVDKHGLGRMPSETRNYVSGNMAMLGRDVPSRPASPAQPDAGGGGDPVPYEVRPRGNGMRDEILDTLRQIGDVNSRQSDMRQEQLAAATKRLQERRFGPTRAEQLFALSAAFAQPLRSRKNRFGQTLGNVAGTLGQLAQYRREGETARADRLLELATQYQNTDAQAERGALTDRLSALQTLAKLEQPKAEYTANENTGEVFNRYTGYSKPNSSHVSALLANPERAREFDIKFGPGAAAEVLDRYGKGN